MSKDVTAKYGGMIEAFECDFNVYEIEKYITEQGTIKFEFPASKRLFDDIELLRELSFNLRHNKCKIVEVLEDE